MPIITLAINAFKGTALSAYLTCVGMYISLSVNTPPS